jgi:WD40 repeat protein
MEIKAHRSLRFYHQKTGKALGTWVMPYPTANLFSPTIALLYNPDGHTLLLGSAEERRIWLFDAETQKLIAGPFPCTNLETIAFRPGRKQVLVVDETGAVLRDTQTGKPSKQKLVFASDREGHFWKSARFTPDGKFIIASTTTPADKGTIKMWNADTGEEVGPKLMDLKSQIDLISLSPDGKRILAAHSDPNSLEVVHVLDIATGHRIGPGFPNFESRLAVSNDSNTLMTSTRPSGTRFWDVTTGKPRGRSSLRAPEALSPNGKFAVLGGSARRPGQLRLWDISAGQPIGRGLFGHPMRMPPDGQYLALTAAPSLKSSLAGNSTSVGKLSNSPSRPGKSGISA